MKIQKFLFSLFLIFIPFQLSLHFWPDFSFVNGIRVDYLSPTIYLFDILLVLLFSFWILKKRELTINKSIVLFILFAFANIAFSLSPFVSLIKWLNLFKLIFLFFFVRTNTKWIKDVLPITLSIGLFISAFIAFGQLVKQSSLGGIFYFLGERSFSSSTPGIALVNIFGHTSLRPYAAFPHPNVLSAFCLVTLIFVLFSNISKRVKLPVIILSLVLILISFSQSIWVALLVISLFFFLSQKLLKKFAKVLFITSALVGLVLPFFSTLILNSGISLPSPLSLRAELLFAAGVVFSHFPVFGVGLGNFILAMNQLVLPKYVLFLSEPLTRLQPVHNIVALVISEIGIIGFIVFIFFIYKLLQKATYRASVLCFVVILLIGFVDHYWLTLYQPQILGVIALGMLQYHRRV